MLDTNVLSALMRGNAATAARLDGLRLTDVLLPQPVIAEVALGIELLPRSKRERVLRRDLERVSGMFSRSPWTDDVSFTYGRLKARLYKSGNAIEDIDIAIAAHALVENAVLATDNLRQFERVPGLDVENWLDDG